MRSASDWEIASRSRWIAAIGSLVGTTFQTAPAEVQVVGLYEPLDPNAAYWDGDPSLLQVSQHGTEFPPHPIAYATAYIPAEMYPSLSSSGLPFHYSWLFEVDPQRLDAGQVARLQVDLQRLGLITGTPAAAPSDTVVVVTGLPRIVDRFAAERAAAESVLSIAAISPFGLAAGAIAMLAILLVRHRRATLALARGRGASGSLVLGTQLWEAILLAGGASLLGLLAALACHPGARQPAVHDVGARGRRRRDPVPSRRELVHGEAVAGQSRARRRAAARSDDRGASSSRPRSCSSPLRRRCCSGSGGCDGRRAPAAHSRSRVNPLLAAVPVVAGLAAGIVALRLYPLPIRALGWLAARRRDLVPVLGLRTIGRHPRGGQPPAPRAAPHSRIRRLRFDALREPRPWPAGGLVPQVGRRLPDRARRAGVLPARAGDGRVRASRPAARGSSIPTAAFASIAPGSARRCTWPRSTLTPTRRSPPGSRPQIRAGRRIPRRADRHRLGTLENPIPAILSRRTAAGQRPPRPGRHLRMTVAGAPLTFRLVQERGTFPGIGEPASFAIVPFNWLQAAFGVGRCRQSSGCAHRRRCGTAGGSQQKRRDRARMVSRYDASPHSTTPAGSRRRKRLRSCPVRRGDLHGAHHRRCHGPLGARRTRDLAYLRALGISAPQALALTVVEHGPPVLLALVPGVALGIGIAILVEPGLGLATFVGTNASIPLFVDSAALRHDPRRPDRRRGGGRRDRDLVSRVGRGPWTRCESARLTRTEDADRGHQPS